MEWRCQGAVAAVAPQHWTATDIVAIYCSSYYIIITFFFLREAFCGLEYAENAFAAGVSPGPHWGSSRRSLRPPSRLGRGHSSQTPPHSTLVPLAIGSASTHTFWLRHWPIRITLHIADHRKTVCNGAVNGSVIINSKCTGIKPFN